MQYLVTFKKVKGSGRGISRTLSAESLCTLIDDKIRCAGFCYVDVMLILLEKGRYEGTHAGNRVIIEARTAH